MNVIIVLGVLSRELKVEFQYGDTTEVSNNGSTLPGAKTPAKHRSEPCPQVSNPMNVGEEKLRVAPDVPGDVTVKASDHGDTLPGSSHPLGNCRLDKSPGVCSGK